MSTPPAPPTSPVRLPRACLDQFDAATAYLNNLPGPTSGRWFLGRVHRDEMYGVIRTYAAILGFSDELIAHGYNPGSGVLAKMRDALLAATDPDHGFVPAPLGSRFVVTVHDHKTDPCRAAATVHAAGDTLEEAATTERILRNGLDVGSLSYQIHEVGTASLVTVAAIHAPWLVGEFTDTPADPANPIDSEGVGVGGDA